MLPKINKSLLIIWCLIVCQNASQLVPLYHESIEGMVEAGNYSFYSYSGDAIISLILHSHEGDGDLYVAHADAAGHVVQPKYDSYDLQSVTCGEDRIDVPHSLPTPLGISVYGHPSHQVTVFTLEVIAYDPKSADDDFNDMSDNGDYMTEEELAFYEQFFGQPYGGMKKVPNKKKVNKQNSDDNNNNKSRNDGHHEMWDVLLDVFTHILQIFLEVLF